MISWNESSSLLLLGPGSQAEPRPVAEVVHRGTWLVAGRAGAGTGLCAAPGRARAPAAAPSLLLLLCELRLGVRPPELEGWAGVSVAASLGEGACPGHAQPGALRHLHM